jgi:hypothetical protein
LLPGCISQPTKEHTIPFQAIRLASRTDGQNSPTPNTTHALFYDGNICRMSK